MSRTDSLTARRLLVTVGLALMLITAGCTGSASEADANNAPETTSDPNKTLERSDDNVNVYTDNTAITVVNYPDSMTKTIYWEDKTVCTRWSSAQEGGVSCLPFNETQLDDRYESPANTNQ